MHSVKWNRRFLDLARVVSTWSKDPSSQIGAVIVRPDKTVASMGFNGFPKQLDDDSAYLHDRPLRLSRTIHAEMNAILHARERLDGYTLYTFPCQPCERCAVHIIQAGIKNVVTLKGESEHEDRWAKEHMAAAAMFAEAGVILDSFIQ